MPDPDKRTLSERDMCTKYITPALTDGSKWDLMTQIREEVYFARGRVIVRGRVSARGEQHRIVAKVEELLGLCDRLAAQLTTAQTETDRLLESLLHHSVQST